MVEEVSNDGAPARKPSFNDMKLDESGFASEYSKAFSVLESCMPIQQPCGMEPAVVGSPEVPASCVHAAAAGSCQDPRKAVSQKPVTGPPPRRPPASSREPTTRSRR